MTDRKYFSGNSLEQAVMNAARHFKIDPGDLNYRQMDKRHGFVKVRRSHVIEVDPGSPRKPLSDDEAYKRAMKMDPEAHLGRDPRDPSYVTDDKRGQRKPGRRSRRRGGRQAKPAPNNQPQPQRRSDNRDEGRRAPARRQSSPPAEQRSTPVESPSPPRDRHSVPAEQALPPTERRSTTAEQPSPPVEQRSTPAEQPSPPREQRSMRAEQPSPPRERRSTPVGQPSPPRERRSAPAEQPHERAADSGERQTRRVLRPADRSDRPAADGSAADSARGGAESLLRLAALDLEVQVFQGDEHLEIELNGNEEEKVTSRRGEVLAALQQLVPSIVRSETGDRVFCRVDCDGFREVHEERLRDLAQRVAGKVDHGQRAQVLESMNPAERRIIHMTLNDDPAVSTESLGKGYYKRVRISPV